MMLVLTHAHCLFIITRTFLGQWLWFILSRVRNTLEEIIFIFPFILQGISWLFRGLPCHLICPVGMILTFQIHPLDKNLFLPEAVQTLCPHASKKCIQLKISCWFPNNSKIPLDDSLLFVLDEVLFFHQIKSLWWYRA